MLKEFDGWLNVGAFPRRTQLVLGDFTHVRLVLIDLDIELNEELVAFGLFRVLKQQ